MRFQFFNNHKAVFEKNKAVDLLPSQPLLIQQFRILSFSLSLEPINFHILHHSSSSSLLATFELSFLHCSHLQTFISHSFCTFPQSFLIKYFTFYILNTLFYAKFPFFYHKMAHQSCFDSFSSSTSESQ